MQRTTNNFNMADPSTKINDLYDRISKEVDRFISFGEKKAPVGGFDVDQQNVILDFVNKGKGEDEKLSIDQIQLGKNERGETLIYGDGDLVGTLPRTATNLKVQPSVKEKRVVVGQGENAPSSGSTYHIKGKDYSEVDLLKMGYTLDQIKKYKK